MMNFFEHTPYLESVTKTTIKPQRPKQATILAASFMLACLLFAAAPFGYGLSILLAGLVMVLAALVASVQTNTTRSASTDPEPPTTV